MAEYKELERALLARMLRAGVIDSSTFLERVKALGYSEDDAFLMLRLEGIEAGRVIVWSGRPEPSSGTVSAYETKFGYSPLVDITNATYYTVRGSCTSDGTEVGIRVEEYDADGNLVTSYTDGVALNSVMCDMTKEPQPVTTQLKIVCWAKEVAGTVDRAFTFHGFTVEVVRLG